MHVDIVDISCFQWKLGYLCVGSFLLLNTCRNKVDFEGYTCFQWIPVHFDVFSFFLLNIRWNHLDIEETTVFHGDTWELVEISLLLPETRDIRRYRRNYLFSTKTSVFMCRFDPIAEYLSKLSRFWWIYMFQMNCRAIWRIFVSSVEYSLISPVYWWNYGFQRWHLRISWNFVTLTVNSWCM